jgi:hypothetical protein
VTNAADPFVAGSPGYQRTTRNQTPPHGEGAPQQAEDTPEDRPDEPGAGSGSGNADATAPFAPKEDDDSPVGDTDQHSDA